jgi:hypothetical protein
MVRWKSAERVIRAFLGSTGVVDWFQAESFVRPLRRRAATMARPARVRIRRRKPCVRLRRRLLGWNVRLLTRKLPQLAGNGLGWRLQESTLDAGVSDLLTVRGPAKPVKPDRARINQDFLLFVQSTR